MTNSGTYKDTPTSPPATRDGSSFDDSVAIPGVTGHVRRHWLAVAVFAALSVVHTWPLATGPGTLSLNDNGDALLNE